MISLKVISTFSVYFVDMSLTCIWTNDDFKSRHILTKIVGKKSYKTFEEYLKKEGLQKSLPGMPSLKHGLSVYYKYFTKSDEAKYGVVAIRLTII